MEFINKFDDFIAKIEGFLLSSSIIAMTVLLVGNVIARRVFNQSWTFAEEVGQFLVVVATFMGLGYAVKLNQHVNMTAILDLVPKKTKKNLVIIISILSTITLFFFAFLGFKYSILVFESGRVTPALEFPGYIVTIFMPLGFLSGAIRYLLVLMLNFKHEDLIYVGIDAPELDYEEEIIDNSNKGENK